MGDEQEDNQTRRGSTDWLKTSGPDRRWGLQLQPYMTAPCGSPGARFSRQSGAGLVGSPPQISSTRHQDANPFGYKRRVLWPFTNLVDDHRSGPLGPSHGLHAGAPRPKRAQRSSAQMKYSKRVGGKKKRINLNPNGWPRLQANLCWAAISFRASLWCSSVCCSCLQPAQLLQCLW